MAVFATMIVLGALLAKGLPRVAPWGYRLVFWVPGLLSAALLGLIFLRFGTASSGVGNSGALAILIFVIPPLLLNLTYLLVPATIANPGYSSNVVTVLLGLGAVCWGAVGVFAVSPENDLPPLYPVAAGLFLLHCLGVFFLLRTTPSQEDKSEHDLTSPEAQA